MAIQRTPELLRLLLEGEVEFVIIGGVAAIAHGSAAFTLDFDIAAPLTEANLIRLLGALASHHPRYAMAGDKRPVTEPPAVLASNRNLYLLTDLGRLDILGEVAPIGSFETLAARADEMEVLGHRCRVISLDDLILVKAHLGRGKDQLVERELRAIRARLRSR
ncbi:MAG: nucleotidyltransferase [Myxococcota bacterium]|nr:nucleotidyltransferase [Myxococcota bacterium]